MKQRSLEELRKGRTYSALGGVLTIFMATMQWLGLFRMGRIPVFVQIGVGVALLISAAVLSAQIDKRGREERSD